MAITELVNFVAARRRRGDVLPKATYESVVQMLVGLTQNIDASIIQEASAEFAAHIVDYNDPHDISDMDWSAQYLALLYAIYCEMTVSPLTYDQFKSQVYGTMAELELIRRILLNRFLYNQIQSGLATGVKDYAVLITEAWGPVFEAGQKINITIADGITDESSFLTVSKVTNTSPTPLVFTGDKLDVYLPWVAPGAKVLMYSSQITPDYRVMFPAAFPNQVLSFQYDDTDLTLGRYTLQARYRNQLNAQSDQVVFTMNPDGDSPVSVVVKANTNGDIDLIQNGASLLASPLPVDDGTVRIGTAMGRLFITNNAGTIRATDVIALSSVRLDMPHFTTDGSSLLEFGVWSQDIIVLPAQTWTTADTQNYLSIVAGEMDTSDPKVDGQMWSNGSVATISNGT